MIGNLARAASPLQGSPLLHGDLGWWDEIALLSCIVVIFVVVVVFYANELRKTKDKPKDE